MTTIFKGRAKEAETRHPLVDKAEARIEAARRLSEGITAAGQAMRDLMEAERAFNAEAGGRTSNGAMQFAQQLFPFLVADINLNAPELAKYLRVPHQAPSRCESIASMVERLARPDIARIGGDAA
ncbi:hypothetical protein NCF86_01585 [Pelagerythrobacter marinus]|nr:hypothetical protein NCF86_01585 [Pelagerythrobacter marinus]